jgi:branched-chain amino acid transport system permease protein
MLSYSNEELLKYVFDGLSKGSIYALVALGLVIIYRGTGHLNFAQGEMGLFGAYCFFQFREWGWATFLALPVALVVGFVLGSLTEIALVRPVGKRSPFAVFIVTIGLFQGLNWLDKAIWGNDNRPKQPPDDLKQYPSLFPNKPTDFFRVLGAEWRWVYFGVLVLVLVLTAALFALFNFTKLGLAMRAVASNSESSKLVGMRTSTVLMFSWGLAAAIAVLGAIVFAGINNQVNPGLMFTVFIYGSAAATLGGFDSPGGAVVAGLSIGVLQTVVTGWLPNQFDALRPWITNDLDTAIAFLVIVVVLLIKPSGLFGTAKVERV